MLPRLVLNTCPIHRHLLTRIRVDTGVLPFASYICSLLGWLGQNLLSTLLRHMRWHTSGLLRSVVVTLHISAPYSSTDSTFEFRMHSLVLWLNLPDLQMFWSLVTAFPASASRLLMSASVPPSFSSTEPRYTKDSTSSASSPSILMLSVHLWFILSVFVLRGLILSPTMPAVATRLLVFSWWQQICLRLEQLHLHSPGLLELM